MSFNDEEKVDMFGRTIVPLNRVSSSGDDKKPRDDDRRDRSNSRGRRRSPPHHPGNFRNNNNNNNNNNNWKGENRGGRDFGGGRGDRRPYPDNRDNNNRGDRGQYGRRPFDDNRNEESFNAPPVPEFAPPRIQPLMSFKNFIQSQKEDHPPEIYQKMYEQYNIDYLGYFSDSFFKASMAEEWFQDRYNPVNIINTEKESIAWAIEESEKFKRDLITRTHEFIQACSLEPSAKTREEGDDILSGRNLPGHENRAVYVSGIHACCPKAVFNAAITSALTAKNELAKPERIVVAQPVWSNRILNKFERTAWVVLPTATLAREAIGILRDLEVKVPSLPDPNTGNAGTAFSFNIQAFLHTPRQAPMLPDFMGASSRVQSDIIRATLLANLLDEDREIPSGQRLSDILLDSSVVEAIKRPTDHLDVAIAYLRRVHFVNFYNGRRYRDEAHLLVMAPAVVFRSRPYLPAPNESTDYSVAAVLAEINNKAADSIVAQEAAEESSAEQSEAVAPVEEGQEEAAKSEEGAKEESTTNEESKDKMTEEGEEGKESNPATPGKKADSQQSGGLKLPYKPINDRKIGPIIADLTQRLERKKAQLTDPSVPGTVDEEDAKRLEKIQDEHYEELVKSRCKFEMEDKCRCCYNYCNKLFRAVSFLSKHLKTKHAEFGMDALLVDAEPFMRHRYEAEDLSARPLPPVEVESNIGIELRSVKDIIDKYMRPMMPMMPPPLPFGPPPGYPMQPPPPSGPPPRFLQNDYHNRDRHHQNNNNNNFQRDNRKRRLNDDDASNPPPPASTNFAPRNNDRGGLFQQRKSTGPVYHDIDAPKESVTGIDYGVALLAPLKKRKLSLKTAAVTKTSAEATPAGEGTNNNDNNQNKNNDNPDSSA